MIPHFRKKRQKKLSSHPDLLHYSRQAECGLALFRKGLFHFKMTGQLPIRKYLEVQNELVAAVNQLRQDFCKLYFDKDYAELNMNKPNEKEISEAIRKIYKMNISEATPKNIGGLN